MNPYQQGQSGYPQQQYMHNIGFSNTAPQSFGNPLPMPGMPTMGYPQPQAGYNPGYPTSGYPASGYPTQGYPQSTPGYPQTNQGYSQHANSAQPTQNPPAHTGYPAAQTGYPAAQGGGYPQAGYPQQNQYQGYPPQGQSQIHHHVHVTSNSVPNVPKSRPTVVPVEPFDPREDAAILRKAMKGFGTDEKSIIHVLTRRSNEQRLRIAFEFKTLYGKDLVSDLKSETSGKFEDLLVALTQIFFISQSSTREKRRHRYRGKDRSRDRRSDRVYGAQLEDDLRGDTSGNFKRLMTSLCMGNRSEDFHVDQDRAREDARSLLQAGELRLGTDESVFNSVLCSRSFPQLAQVFQEYQFLTGHDLDDAIKAEFSGEMEKAFRAIVKVVRNKPLYFAERLHSSMKGLGTNDRQLIRIMVTRCEVDLGDIADMFQAKYGESLQEWIEGDCSGHYKKCLLGLLGLY